MFHILRAKSSLQIFVTSLIAKSLKYCVGVVVCGSCREMRDLLISLCFKREHKGQIRENNSAVKAAVPCHSSY